jgi:hypothetical protein
MKYWSQFISHEIKTVAGIRWYFANVLVQCGVIPSSNGTLKINFSESIKQYIDNEACIYQSCYQEPAYHSFTIQYYQGNNNINNLTGMISSYDCVFQEYHVIINTNQDSTISEYRFAVSPSVMEPKISFKRSCIGQHII